MLHKIANYISKNEALRKSSVFQSALKVGVYGMKAYYDTPNFLHPKVEISPEAQQWLQEFRRDGCLLIRDKFSQVADYINSTYTQNIEQGNLEPLKALAPGFRARSSDYKDIGGEFQSYFLGFRDPGLAPFLLNSDLMGMIYNYMGRQPYYRSEPMFEKIKTQDQVSMTKQGKFHIDWGISQINFMLLLKDIGPNDTRLQFAAGSHRWFNTKIDRFTYTDEWVVEKYAIRDMIGKKGDLVIFDGGHGFHRIKLMPNSTRTLLGLVLTSGLNVEKFKESTAGWSELDRQPAVVSRMFDKVSLV